MLFKSVMHTDVDRPKREYFDSDGAVKDIEEMQAVIEIICVDAALRGKVDLKCKLDVVYNRLEECLSTARGLDPGEPYTDRPETAPGGESEGRES